MRVWVAARDAGGANILLPVLRRLEANLGVQLHIFGEGPALRLFRQGGAAAEEVPSGSDEQERFLHERWKQTPPDALLLGTSWGPSIEKELLQIGQQSGVPALSVVDHWSNYRDRFTEPGSGRLRLPNQISVMDEIALDQAVTEGLPREILRIGGQPHLQSLAAMARDAGLLEQARRLRAAWLGEQRDSKLILFGSERFSDDFRRGTPHDRGYTETDALEGLVEALRIVETQDGRRLKLVVKLHPKEERERFRPGPLARDRGFLLAQAEPPWACLLAADGVVGMTSMLLVEAALLGRPAVSFQPAQGIAAPFIGTESGLVHSARTPEEISVHLEELADDRGGTVLASEEVPRRGCGAAFRRRLLSGDAAARIAELLLDLRAEVVG